MGPDLIARQQAQEAVVIGGCIVLPVHIPEQRVAVHPSMVDEAGAADEGRQGDPLAQGQERRLAGLLDQRLHADVGPFRMMQHAFHQPDRLGGGELRLVVQRAQIVAVQLPHPHRHGQHEHQQGAQQTPARASGIESE
ncbi:hypothetical protein D3C80_1529530 [compost metagenome]